MKIELAISILALLISLLSAVYSRWSFMEKRQANRISSHSHKLDILQSVSNFQAAFRVNGESVEDTYFDSLFSAAKKSRLYFSQPIYDHLSRYADAAFKVLIARDGAKRSESVNREVPSEKWEEIFSLVDKCRAAEGTLLADLESETKLVD
jgi:hypothetical protein